MPGKCKFKEVWLTEDVWRLWLRQGKDDHTGFCSLCKKFIDVSHSGINDVKCHAKGKKHRELEDNLRKGKQLTLHAFKSPTSACSSRPKPSSINAILENEASCTVENEPSCSNSVDCSPSTSTQHDVGLRLTNSSNLDLGLGSHKNISSFLLSDSVTEAEVMWAAYCVSTHTSTRSGEKAINIFPKMFPDSNIAPKIKMHKDKIAYSVTYGLGPYFANVTANNVRRSPIFALSIDECLNDISQKQQLDVMANFWDSDTDRVRTTYLTSAFLEKTAAENLLESVLTIIKDTNLNLENLVQLSTDGPNVNLKLLFDIKQHMRDNLPSEKQILDIGTCSLHIINGAYKTAHNKINWKLNDFLRALYRLFKNYPSRRGVYKQITNSSVFPKKFCAVRWTENSSVIQRCLEMLPHLRQYVSEVKNKAPDSGNFLHVKNVLTEDKTLEAKLHFSSMIASELEEFLTLFQRNDPLLPFLHQEVFLLMKNLASRFVKKSILDNVTSASKLKQINLDLDSNLKAVDTIDIGFGARAALKNVKDIDAQRFRLDCKRFLLAMFRKLLEKSPLNKRVVLGATCLNPSLMLNETLRENRIKIAIEEFVAHNQLTPAEGDVILRSYMRFCENTHVKEKLQQFNWNKVRLDTLFGEIFHELKDDEIVPKLKRFIQLILVCFHGNAAVERSFSFNKNFLIENLEENSLVAQRHLHNHICSLPGEIF